MCECQTVLFYDVSEDVLVERCMARAKTSGRADDNVETLKKRFNSYNESTRPVVEMYQRFGKVRHIDASGEINDVYQRSKNALLPEIFFLIGPKASGKSTIGNQLAAKTNMRLWSFEDFLKRNKLRGKDDETIVFTLIRELLDEVTPRVLIEDFPQNPI